MIHQHIFAGPKPGMSEADFQDYWIKVHAVKYASRIREIRRYSISRRLRPSSGDDVRLPFGGVAEIWLENEQEQLASLQSPEFIDGARVDEPRWAAFWNTLGLDTTTHSPAPPAGITSSTGQPGFKVFVLLKRQSGSKVEDFRRAAIERHPAVAWTVPGLCAFRVCLTVDSGYVLGEPRFDAVLQYCFDDRAGLERGTAAGEYIKAVKDLEAFAEPRYLFQLWGQEHWIIGPDHRQEKTP